jgi:hypothetical protein
MWFTKESELVSCQADMRDGNVAKSESSVLSVISSDSASLNAAATLGMRRNCANVGWQRQALGETLSFRYFLYSDPASEDMAARFSRSKRF